MDSLDLMEKLSIGRKVRLEMVDGHIEIRAADEALPSKDKSKQ